MKVGIITCTDYTNYGNRLQNYALDYLLKESNIIVKNGLYCDIKSEWVEKSSSSVIKILKVLCPFFVFKRYKAYLRKIDDPLLLERQKKFVDFTNKYMDTFPYLCVRNYSDLNKRIDEDSFDFFIAGSDQVWNPYINGYGHNFLLFSDKEKRLSFSASLGVNEIPSKMISKYKEYFDDMKLISVREKYSVEVVKRISNRNDVFFTMDPTLLLTANEWNAISKKPKQLSDDRYICTYFLGNQPSIVDKIAEREGLKVYALNNKKCPELYALAPSEFIYMIQNATIVLTDSFHATAFSIIFHKPFYVFRRQQKNIKNMFGRLESLLNFFGLKDKIIVGNFSNYHMTSNEINWSKIDFLRQEERTKSMNMLLKSMGLI